MIPSIGSSLPAFEARRIDPGASAASLRADVSGGADFGSVLARLTTGTVDALKGAETTSVAAIRGDASTQAVVDAVMGAERALQTAVVLRDKVVAAYQEIARMAI